MVSYSGDESGHVRKITKSVLNTVFSTISSFNNVSEESIIVVWASQLKYGDIIEVYLS